MKKLAIATMIIFALGCARSPTAKTMSGAFAACMNADLGAQVSAEGLTGDVISVVAALVTRNVPQLEADLAGLAAQLGPDAILCAIAAVDAALSPPAVAIGSGSAESGPESPATTARPLPGLVRLRAWAGSHPSPSPRK